MEFWAVYSGDTLITRRHSKDSAEIQARIERRNGGTDVKVVREVVDQPE